MAIFLDFKVDYSKKLCYNILMIKREIEQKISARLNDNKAIIIYGPRQVGKTTLLHTLFDKNDDVAWYNGDNLSTQEDFERADAESLKSLVGNKETVIIDEAQRIKNIGLKLKILHDNFGKTTQFIATGSSSFDLANKINEPLTGRKWTYLLFPFTIKELVSHNGLSKEKANLENRLKFGSYPAVINDPASAEDTLRELTNENLYKDVLSMGEIIKTDKLKKILQALALQIGSQVSIHELAQTVGLDDKTTDKYISLLEQSFIIFRLPSFARNLRNELKSSQKIYFYDVGIRNSIINDFRPIDLRPDKGNLFENYIISELKKRFHGQNIWFWRNTDQQEIDFLIERNGEISIFEIKYHKKNNFKFPATFTKSYNPGKSFIINQENCTELLSGNSLDYLEK